MNYEWLLADDLYTPSPVIFGLRLQHLEETLELYEKLEECIKKVAKDGQVRYEDVATVLGGDPAFYTIQDSDLARGFNVSLKDARMDTTADTDSFLRNLRNGKIFPAMMKENEGGEVVAAAVDVQS